ncbi:pyruvate, phosphate dikinase [[Actinomadura] parvosata subsp. kistnae]|uniref:Pyruvate, phosphate dikinase n=1 Tax=[Actinomadura] parvosata subsp. kistnae TaxID=1909395 RepID=A0A1V0AH51_9ACTN|nr:PEP/pyruvate-binding domain-containing protein [Nonomuraea sp. ATCC 55076]AQZ69530.1 pyruvate, phosphate dikinase [Nonomuraea sp. ATCC 55076]
MIVPLAQAVAGTCGGKAGALGALLRAGLPVPDGFVVPFAAYRAAARDPAGSGDLTAELAGELAEALAEALAGLGDPVVAVRSSASGEDTGQASAAGQHESFLAVHGAGEVAAAVRSCWASLFSERAVHYRGTAGGDDLAMAVIVQRHLDAEVSGVMFTGNPTRIEASWGLGPSVVGGTVTPDAYVVTAGGSVTRTVASKRTRLDRHGTRLVTSEVPAPARDLPALDDATAIRLAGLGERIAAACGGPQDIEWAITGDRIWILQARPITAALPPPPGETHAPTALPPHGETPPPATLSPTDAEHPPATLPPSGAEHPPAAFTGAPGSRGTATGTARIVRGPADFARVRPGDILVCPFTDPAWTPLLRVAAGVVTETGGVLSHAAIVARECAIPAVLGVPDATTVLRDGALITVDGTTGTVTTGTVTT